MITLTKQDYIEYFNSLYNVLIEKKRNRIDIQCIKDLLDICEQLKSYPKYISLNENDFIVFNYKNSYSNVNIICTAYGYQFESDKKNFLSKTYYNIFVPYTIAGYKTLKNVFKNTLINFI